MHGPKPTITPIGMAKTLQNLSLVIGRLRNRFSTKSKVMLPPQPKSDLPSTIRTTIMKKPLRTFTYIAGLSFTALFAGCDRGPTPPLGKPCTIQFRRDALGAGASVPVPPMTDNINGAHTSISGTLKSTAGDWVVLDRSGGEVWVPKAAILLIKY